jgi:hypothetical protein
MNFSNEIIPGEELWSQYTLPEDCHFGDLASCYWITWEYGPMLTNAKTVEDPELRKLEALFKALN